MMAPSLRNWRISRKRDEPIASRIVASCRRPTASANNKFATFAHAIKITNTVRRSRIATSSSGGAIFILFRISRGKLLRKQSHFRLRLSLRHAGFESGEKHHVSPIAGRLCIGSAQRFHHVAIHAKERSAELLRRNANNRRAADVLADNLRIGPEPLPPGIRHHSNRRLSTVIATRKQSPQIRLEP